MTVSASGIEPSQRHLNNIQTTGREYRNVTEPAFEIDRTNDVGIPNPRRHNVARRCVPPGGRGQVPGAGVVLPLSKADPGPRRPSRFHRGRSDRLLRPTRLCPGHRERSRHRRQRGHLLALRPPGVAGHRGRDRMGRRAAIDDQPKGAATLLGFTHTPIAQPSLNTVFSSSRLLLPLLDRAAD